MCCFLFAQPACRRVGASDPSRIANRASCGLLTSLEFVTVSPRASWWRQGSQFQNRQHRARSARCAVGRITRTNRALALLGQQRAKPNRDRSDGTPATTEPVATGLALQASFWPRVLSVCPTRLTARWR